MQTIKNIFIDGMDLIADKSEYCDNIDEELSRIGIDVGEEMDEILKHFHEINKDLKVKMYKEQAEEIFKCIPMKMETFYAKFTEEYMEKPLLEYYDTFKMIQRITCASNEDIVRIKEILIDRAKRYASKLQDEYNFMKQLKKALEDYCKGKPNNIKIVMLKEFYRDLGIVIDLYKPTLFSNNKEENQNN